MNGLARPRALSIYLVAAEESGDALGAALAGALRTREGDGLSLAGVGGRAMAAAGIASPFAIDDLSIIGFSSIPRRRRPSCAGFARPPTASSPRAPTRW